MLHRSFKPAKCKTSLKLASSRIKLLKNKRDAQVKHLKKELAQLLESGQDQTARIRVEHVVREEKTMAAYDLLVIYCELIVARLPIIESQKNCPIDLKEAISSVIFASPRCADVPELLDVRKHFTTKYGKDFVSAAVELRPDCGVSRLLVEKLSAQAPDGPTKIKILTAIAEEHNIKWEPKSFGEIDSKPSEDLLNGPNAFTSASQMFGNPPNVQVPPNVDDKGPSNFQVPSKSKENHGVPANFHDYNLRPSSSSQIDNGANQTNNSAAFPRESMPTGSGSERMEFRDSHSGDGNASFMHRQNWNMEFKDATAAAEAAAESAERASMAARAAAELASHGNTTWQHSTESRRDEQPNRYTNSTLRSEHQTKGPLNIVNGRNARMDYEKINSNQQDDVAGIAENIHGDSLQSSNKTGRLASLKTSAASADGSAFVNNLYMADRYSQKDSSELGQGENLSEVSSGKQPSRSEIDYTDKLQGLDSKSVVFEDARIRKQSSHVSSHSHSSSFGDDHDVLNYDSQSLDSDADENPFAVNNEGMVRRNSNKTSSPENASVVYDDYVSDQDECKIDLQGRHKGHEYTEFSTRSGKSPTHMFSNSNAWSERQNIDESLRISFSGPHFTTENQSDPLFSGSWTSSNVPFQPDEMLPATFDDYDIPTSKGEGELDGSKLFRSKDTKEGNIYSRTSVVTRGESHGFIDSSFVEEGNEGSSKPLVRSPSIDPPNHLDVHSGRNQGTRVDAGSPRKFGYGDVTIQSSPPRFTPSKSDFDDPYSYGHEVDERTHEQSQQPSTFSMSHEVTDNVSTPVQAESIEETETSKESILESGKGLNYANLTGGLRNRGFKRQPYMMSQSNNVSSFKQTAEHTSNPNEALNASINPGTTSQGPYNRDTRAEADRRPSARAYIGSHDDDLCDELPQKTSTSSQERHTRRGGIAENKMSSSRTQFKYFDSTDGDSSDDFPGEALINKAHVNTGLSRRTRPSSSNSQESTYSNATILSAASVGPDLGEGRNSPTRSLSSNQTSQRPVPQRKISGHLGRRSEQPRVEKQAANKPIQELKRSSLNDSLMPSEKEQQSNSSQKMATSGNIKTLNTLGSSSESPSKEKASHVHPKLPDYDALTAQLQSLRKNRQ